MCNDNLFYICKHCGNIIGMINSSGVKVVCCGEQMQELVPNTVDASLEKHLPVVKIEDNIVTVTIGSVLHPMLKEHHIDFVYLKTKNGGQRKCIEIGKEPKVTFSIDNDEVIAVYAYCNLHGLWMTRL